MPGFTSSLATDGITSVNTTVPGIDYSANPEVTISGDGLGAEVRKIKVNRDAGCPLCGDNPTIHDLSIHETAA